MIWQIHYSDGSTFSSDDGIWEEASGGDVQVVLFRDPELGWIMRHGANSGSPCDYFRLADDGTVVGMDEDGMKYHVVHTLGAVKQGRMLSRAKWDKVFNQAMAMRNELRAIDGHS